MTVYIKPQTLPKGEPLTELAVRNFFLGQPGSFGNTLMRGIWMHLSGYRAPEAVDLELARTNMRQLIQALVTLDARLGD